jgi:hypothetical protein
LTLAIYAPAVPEADRAAANVVAYVHGATSAEIGLRQLMHDRGWISGAETRTGLSAQMTWLLN